METVAIAIFKVVALLIGAYFAHLGYKLFTRGIGERGGELKAAWGDRSVLLKQVAPGVFFALFGAGIVVYVAYKGFHIESTTTTAPTEASAEVLISMLKAAEGDTLTEREKDILKKAVARDTLQSTRYYAHHSEARFKKRSDDVRKYMRRRASRGMP
jgi:hypothetical protein